MSISVELGEEGEARLKQGIVRYRERGSGPVLLFVHGLWVNGDHWRKVVPLLAGRYRCVTPDLPLGAHTEPLDATATNSPSDVADLIVDFIAALDLSDVTVISNDTGTAIAQLLAVRGSGRTGRYVMTTGDAFTNFLPYGIKPMRLAAFLPGGLKPVAAFWNTRLGRRLIFLPLARRFPGPRIAESYFAPAARSGEIRRDLAKFLRGAGPRQTLRAARRLSEVERPVLLAWSLKGRYVFPLGHARRLAALLPDSRLELVADSMAFIPEDQPERLARLISDFVQPRDEALELTPSAATARSVDARAGGPR